jgi:hypothetical protein
MSPVRAKLKYLSPRFCLNNLNSLFKPNKKPKNELIDLTIAQPPTKKHQLNAETVIEAILSYPTPSRHSVWVRLSGESLNRILDTSDVLSRRWIPTKVKNLFFKK